MRIKYLSHDCRRMFPTGQENNCPAGNHVPVTSQVRKTRSAPQTTSNVTSMMKNHLKNTPVFAIASKRSNIPTPVSSCIIVRVKPYILNTSANVIIKVGLSNYERASLRLE